ncbi:MAG: RHS repeat-associated core domain-containing protein [Desulfobacteraceae bacterium]|nr:RHS repeat-associated core domain-containing protein [Desulfobacteraceae bacterium]
MGNGSEADSNVYRFSTKYYDTETGLYYYGFRYFSSELGRWINRDPISENGGINMYLYTQNDSVNWVDPFGLWKRKSPQSHVWIAESGDTLSSLAAMAEYGGRGKNWRCLWPVEGTEDHGYPNIIKPCDKYDASNLATPAPGAKSLIISVAPDKTAGFKTVFGELLEELRGDKVADKVKTDSGQGGTPISEFIVAGHSGYEGMVGAFDRLKYRFTAQQLVDLNEAPSFLRAVKKRGPVRCWFTQDAVAYFPGCNSDEVMARPFAKNILRKGAKAYGTNQLTEFSNGGISYNWTDSPTRYGYFASSPDWKNRAVWTPYDATW